MVVLHLRTVPSSAARCFASADFASLCVLEASAASRPPMRAVLPPLSSAWSPLCVRKAHLRCFLLHWAHRRLLHPQFAMVVLLRPTACSTPASQFSMVASLRSQSSLEMLPASLGSSTAIAPSIRNGRPAAPYGLQYSLAHWAYYGLFRALRAAFVRPTGCAVSFALIGVFVPACASLARYSGAADALWACPRPSTPSGLRRLTACFAHCARAFVRPTGCAVSFALIGLTPRCFAHSASLFVRPFGQSLRRGYAAPPSSIQHGRLASCAKRSCDAPCVHWAYCGLFPRTGGGLRAPLFLREKGGFWAVLLHCGSATNQKAPLDSKGELSALAD